MTDRSDDNHTHCWGDKKRHCHQKQNEEKERLLRVVPEQNEHDQGRGLQHEYGYEDIIKMKSERKERDRERSAPFDNFISQFHTYPATIKGMSHGA